MKQQKCRVIIIILITIIIAYSTDFLEKLTVAQRGSKFSALTESEYSLLCSQIRASSLCPVLHESIIMIIMMIISAVLLYRQSFYASVCVCVYLILSV
jgi:hypothetical protein